MDNAQSVRNSTVDPCSASHVEGTRYLAYFMPQLLLHSRTDASSCMPQLLLHDRTDATSCMPQLLLHDITDAASCISWPVL